MPETPTNEFELPLLNPASSRCDPTTGALTADTLMSASRKANCKDMNDAAVITESALLEPAETTGRKWSAGKAFLIGWLLPSTTAQRTQELPLRRAWLAHFVAVVIALAVISVCVRLADAYSITATQIAFEIQEQLSDIVEEFQRHPYATPFRILGIFALIELGHAALALFLMAWGACDEPLRNSYRNAIRQVWLRGAHVIPAAIVISSIAIPLSRMDTAWDASYLVPRPEWPKFTQNAQPGSAAMTNYNKALQEFWVVDRDWRNERDRLKPWYLVTAPGLIGVTVCSTILWFLWSLLRSVGAPRRAPQIARPPMCENCGYNLTTLAMTSVCPECAEPVLDSVGPDARPGPTWLQRHTRGRITTWWNCVVDPILHPTAFGRQCRLEGHRTDHRRFFVLPFPAVFAMGPTAVLSILAIYDDPIRSFTPPRVVITAMALLVGYLCCLGMLGFTLLAQTVIGFILSFREKRNLLPAAAQVASYLAGYLTLWAALGAVTMVGVAALDHAQFFNALQERWGFPSDLAMKFTWFLPNAACGVWYLVLLSRGTLATRYANK